MTNRSKPQPVNVYNTVNGPNGRIVGGDDHSSNSVHLHKPQVFKDLETALRQHSGSEALSPILEKLEAIRDAQDKEAAQTAYSRFVGSLADHVSLLTAATPYLPLLIHWSRSL